VLTLLGCYRVGVLGLGCIEHPVGTAADFEGAFLSRDFVDAAVGTDSGLAGIEIVDFDQVGSAASAIAERLERRANMGSQDQAYESGEKDIEAVDISEVVQHS
jgi:hypothetical protein